MCKTRAQDFGDATSATAITSIAIITTPELEIDTKFIFELGRI